MDREQIVEALLDAFNKAEMVRVVRTHLDEDLGDIVGGESFTEVVGNLVSWAQRRNKLSALVLGSFSENPGNQHLKNLVLSNHWKESGGYRNRITIDSSEGDNLNGKELLEIYKKLAYLQVTLEQVDSRMGRVEAELKIRKYPDGNRGTRYTEHIFYLIFLSLFLGLLIVGLQVTGGI